MEDKIIKNSNKFQKKLISIKSLNKKIVLCHGVFDILHLGHLKYFESAKKLGDLLIVSVTSDTFVRNKYFSKPYFDISKRMEALKFISDIDYIIESKFNRANSIIKFIKPDYYVKGPDYKNQKRDKELNEEIKELKKYGGVFKTTNTEQFSSTNILFNNFRLLNDKQLNYISSIKKNEQSVDITIKLLNSCKPKVLVIGETIIDEYIECEAIGTSSKEPILVTKILNTNQHLGGIISILNHLKDFSKSISALTALGSNDSENSLIIDKIDKKINFHHITKSNSPIIKKTRYIENYTKNKMFGSYELNDSDLLKSDNNLFLKKLKKYLPSHDLIYLVDYGHGLISKDAINFIKSKSKFLCINKQLNSNNKNKFNLDIYQKCDLFCIQESEIRFHFKDQATDIKLLSKKYFDGNKFKVLIVTLGVNGSLLINKSNIIECPAFSNKGVIDRVGAGDTFFSIASLLLWNKIDNDQLLLISSLAAGEKISHLGNSFALTRDNLINNLKNILK